MSYEDVQRLVEQRLHAVEEARGSEDPATQKRALDAASDSQGRINAIVAQMVKDREDEEARAKFEAATRANPEAAFREERGRFNCEIGKMARGERTARLELPHPSELRTDYPLTTATNDSTDYAYYNIATKLWNEVVYHENAQSGVLKAGPKIIRTPGDGPLQIPVLSTDAAAAAGTEGSAPANSTYPVFTRPELKAYRVDGYMVVSDEMMRSPDYPFYDVLSEIAARALATQEAIVLARGGGTTEGNGLFPQATAGITAASQTTFTMDELRQLYFKPVAGERANGKFLMSTIAMQTLALMKDGTGNYLWRGATEATLPDTLLGKPCIEEAHADANNAIAATEKHVVFGSVDGFWVRYAGGLVIEPSKEFSFTSWLTVIRFALWMDCGLVRPGSIYRLTQHAG